MFIPFSVENNSSLMLYMTFLNAILALLTVVRMNIATDSCTYYIAHAHMHIVPSICTLTCTFCLAPKF